MSALSNHLEDYLRLRRGLGHQLAESERLLPSFIEHLDSIGASTITVEAALAWVQRPDADPSSSVWLRRMTAVRGFARLPLGHRSGHRDPPAWVGDLPSALATAIHLLGG